MVAQNEERTIGIVLEAAKKIADEIIFVDSGSSDQTLTIAKEYGAKIFHQEWLGYARQKNFAMGLATGDWILSLDADEVMSPYLVREIEALLGDPKSQEFDGFKIPRLLYIGEHPISHGGFFPDAQLRLIKNGAGLFNERLVHEAIKVNGKTQTLKHQIDHYSYSNLAEFDEAMEKYAKLHAREFANKAREKPNVGFLQEVIHPLWTFFYRYVLRQGFLDGRLGLILNLRYSAYVAKKIRYLRELRAKADTLGE
jgi:glycosyltransferase involved in cell wall biosynthesis